MGETLATLESAENASPFFREMLTGLARLFTFDVASNSTMEIFINDIPEEGLHETGKFPASIFDLSPDDTIRPMGAVLFDVHIHAFDEVIAFYGSLKGPFQLKCGTCLEYNDYEADFSDWKTDLDLEEKQRSFILEEVIREEFILNLPEHLRCDELIEGHVCPKAELVDQVLESAESDDESGGNPDAWKALDDL